MLIGEWRVCIEDGGLMFNATSGVCIQEMVEAEQRTDSMEQERSGTEMTFPNVTTKTLGKSNTQFLSLIVRLYLKIPYGIVTTWAGFKANGMGLRDMRQPLNLPVSNFSHP